MRGQWSLRTFSFRQFTKRNQQIPKVQNLLDDVREVKDVSLGVCVGRLVGLQGEGAVVEGQPPEVHMVGVVEAPRRLLAAPLVLPFCRGDVAADGEEPNYTYYSLEVRVLVLTVCLPDAVSFPSWRFKGQMPNALI